MTEVAGGLNLCCYWLPHHLKSMLDNQPSELFAIDQFDRDTLLLFLAFRFLNRHHSISNPRMVLK